MAAIGFTIGQRIEAVYESKEAKRQVKHRAAIDFKCLPADYVMYLDNYKLTR